MALAKTCVSRRRFQPGCLPHSFCLHHLPVSCSVFFVFFLFRVLRYLVTYVVFVVSFTWCRVLRRLVPFSCRDVRCFVLLSPSLFLCFVSLFYLLCHDFPPVFLFVFFVASRVAFSAVFRILYVGLPPANVVQCESVMPVQRNL